MSIKSHKDYDKELNRLEETIDYVEKIISTIENTKNKFKEDIKDAYINLDYLDSSLSYSTIMLNTTLLESLENNFEQLLNAREKPYFAKMDIQQADKDKIQELYIGKISLFDDSMENPMVIDWRAPIAGVYYDGRLGNASYEVAGEQHNIELYMKRQYSINEGRLLDFMEVDISVSDTFLQASLEAHAEDKLKDIVSTIQAEQNAIIRADIHKPLLVQGVAGSGKTTIALHRIAYLIYTYSETFKPHNFMIIAPNHLFLDYISQVLPELGADKVKQTTYVDFMLEIIGKKYKITDSNVKLIEVLENQNNQNKLSTTELIAAASKFKGSMQMKSIIDQYVENLKKKIVPKQDFFIGNQLFIKQEEIYKVFLEEFSHLPLLKRVNQIKLFLNKRVKSESPRLLDKISTQYNQQIQRIRDYEEPTEARRQKIVMMIEERDSRLELIQKSSKTAVAKYMNLFSKEELIGYYRMMITDPVFLGESSTVVEPLELYQFISSNALILFNKKQFEIEDLAPIVYLKKKLYGVESQDIKYVVMDEAQDFSEFQFYLLKDILETERFTILGDLSQGIHMHRSIQNWEFVKNEVFQKEVTYLSLEQSYRTTVEIMNLANKVLSHYSSDDFILAKPVVRHGKLPTIKSFCCKNEMTKCIEKKILELKDEGYSSVAIIGKTRKDCMTVKKQFTKNGIISAELLDEKVQAFNHELVIIPSYLAKGLEFDAVIIATYDDCYIEEDLDIKLLYVSMTRALHRLDIFCAENTIPLLDEIIEDDKK